MLDLHDIVAKTRRLRELAKPTRAIILEILAELSDEALNRVWNDRLVADQDVSVLAVDLGIEARIIHQVLGKFIRLELVDYASCYLAYKEFYLSKDYSEGKIIASLRGQCRKPMVHCVLHQSLYQWTYEDEAFVDLIIEDDDIGVTCKGYLVAKGLAFGNSVDLLANSYEQSWPNWRCLWKYF